MTYEHVLACTLRMRCDHSCANLKAVDQRCDRSYGERSQALT